MRLVANVADLSSDFTISKYSQSPSRKQSATMSDAPISALPSITLMFPIDTMGWSLSA